MSKQIPEFGTKAWLTFFQKNKAAFNALDNQIFTKDGLLPSKEILVVREGNSYNLWLRKTACILLYPHKHSNSVTRYLIFKPELWEYYSLRVTPARAIYSRIPMFGVPFKKAVQIALKKGFNKSEFYLPDLQDDVFYAVLLIHINRRKESNGNMLELQAWQYCPKQSEVFYIHAESTDFSNTVVHLDGATINFKPDQIHQLFTICEKIKDDSYQKHFRLDGEIPIEEMYNIIGNFMPVEQLTHEAFEIGKSI